jgi:hypothetical protein
MENKNNPPSLAARLIELILPKNEPSAPVQASALPVPAPDTQGLIQVSELQSLVGRANEAISTLQTLLPLLPKIGTDLWRMKQKMVQPGTDEPQEEMRRAYRHLQSIWDVMKDAGIEIQDHTNTPFNSGLSLNVISFQPMTGINSEIVIETIKPTIYYQKQRIQMGEVIVGIPEGKAIEGQNT